MRIALAQLNPLVGDLPGNSAAILRACRCAAANGAELLLTPELSLWGYPPRDLLLHPARLGMQQQALEALVDELAAAGHELQLLVGAALPIGDGQQPDLHNAIVLLNRHGWRPVANKQLLPNYDVFDERRYFRPGTSTNLLNLPGGQRLGLTICEDLWVDADLQRARLSGPDPIAALEAKEPDLLINLAASPFDASKAHLRRQLAARAARRLDCPVIYLNQVGGNDELVFDGSSFVVDADGTPQLELPFGREAMRYWESGKIVVATKASPAPDPLELLFRALVLGVRDYARKCGFKATLLGLSGGIDSALVAVVATAALGADRVSGLLMPSPWSSNGSIHDASALARRLGLTTRTLPIAALMDGFDQVLTPALGHQPEGVTAENLQSRIRGTLLMAMANQQGQLLTTGNKSELAVAIALYGDMNGGLAVIGDSTRPPCLPSVTGWMALEPDPPNRSELPTEGELVGVAIRCKPPSAELRPEQKDSDSLPDYGVLDRLLKELIEERRAGADLIDAGHDPGLVQRVETLLKRAEFKRRQAAPLLKVCPQAFGTGWRLPIASA